MKNNLKKLSTILLIIIMAFSLLFITSCGGDENSNDNSSSSSTTDAASSDSTKDDDTSSDVTSTPDTTTDTDTSTDTTVDTDTSITDTTTDTDTSTDVGSSTDNNATTDTPNTDNQCKHTDTYWVTDEDSTCSKEGSKHEVCKECNETINTDTIAKKDHTWDNENGVISGVLEATRTCELCGQKQVSDLKNIASSATISVTDGGIWDMNNALKVIVNGIWIGDEGGLNEGFAPKGTAFTLEFVFDDYVQIDQIAMAVSGYGMVRYKVYALFEDETDYVEIGSGSDTGSRKQDSNTNFEIGDKKVLKIKLEQTAGPNGEAYWTEIAFGQISQDAVWQDVIE